MAVHHPYFKKQPIKPAPTNQNQDIPWEIRDLFAAYNFPTNLSADGIIGIVELGGGYYPTDIQMYCTNNNIPVPTITDVSVDSGATNSPGTEADIEVALDIQIAAAMYSLSTGKAANIRVYWANNDLGGIARAIDAAAADKCDVCSISWGSDEANWGLAAAIELNQSAMAATGMIVFAAAGDNDSSDGGPGAHNVDCPASAPYVVACGGTNKSHNTSAQEIVWNDNPGNTDGEGTGGGYSTFFAMPTWQAGAPNGPGKMVPDISANADPVTGYNIIYRGQVEVVGGTSAVAPLFAGFFAAVKKQLGFISPKLWANHVAFNDITVGNNGYYRAQPGPDPCSGIGSPIGNKIAALFS